MSSWRLLLRASIAVFACLPGGSLSAAEPPHVVLISVDTLRADRLGSYGYSRDTSPNIDALLAAGARFPEARTVEPLTSPGLTSMLTALYPHEHGATRNGVRMREGLPSVSKVLRRRGYRTGAFVGNWTLNDKISGLAEHFDDYETVLTQRRWLLWAREATAEDLNGAALDWLKTRREEDPRQRIALWIHYVEPHSPYENHSEFATRLGIEANSGSRKNRYDTEIAFVDARIGELLEAVDRLLEGEPTLVIFTADHGESLGEHGYWGHGRHCWEPGLRIPLGFTWKGRIAPQVVEGPGLITDIPKTVLGLLDLPVPESFQGLDWTPVFDGDAPPPTERVTFYQSHRGAVHGSDAYRVRERGLLEVALVDGSQKEILRVGSGNRRVYDLASDPWEESVLPGSRKDTSERLSAWLEAVRRGLVASDELPLPELSEEEIERLRALGYLD